MNRLKQLRKAKGLSQKKAAEKIGIYALMLSKYEIETVQPTALVLIDIADFYGVSIDYILCRDNHISKAEKEKAKLSDEIDILKGKLREIKGIVNV